MSSEGEERPSKRQRTSESLTSSIVSPNRLGFGLLGAGEHRIDQYLATTIAVEEIHRFLKEHGTNTFELILFVGEQTLVDQFLEEWTAFLGKHHDSMEGRLHILLGDLWRAKSATAQGINYAFAEVTWRYLANCSSSRQMFAAGNVTHTVFGGKTTAAGVAKSILVDKFSLLHTDEGIEALILIKVPNMNAEKPDALTDMDVVRDELRQSWRAGLLEFQRLINSGTPTFGRPRARPSWMA
ncbi:hypothetical protein M427DRAFT_211372 [Gonapodya prolifera JEL478]|uniref:Uncharacterized protein n=1 Tax=Gonapodya prolifera (strain JEL478) TaxID=1344416 RepID=A0A139AP17_GONPJ|nr:hypothetical protein M427DRAFT_211372 [Gonapodya prolifera JEL478]|eukprot:KXS18476.1 hypothetical protein M427DRAFT_211372 [Gonapodya prolifera JEL478]